MTRATGGVVTGAHPEAAIGRVVCLVAPRIGDLAEVARVMVDAGLAPVAIQLQEDAP